MEGIKTINKEDLRRHLIFIASDSLQGRKFGTEISGLEITADYLKDYAQKIGLKPHIDDFFQSVGIIATMPGLGNIFIEVVNQKKKSVFNTNSVVSLNGRLDALELEGEEIVIAGFGWQDPGNSYDDFEGIDVAGKIVIYAQGNPDLYLKGENFSWNNRQERAKFEKVFKQKPKAIIIASNPKDKKNNTFNRINRWNTRTKYFLNETNESSDEQAIFLTEPSFVDVLLGGKGRFKKYLNDISKNKKAYSFLVNDFKINLVVRGTSKLLDAKNVVGIIEGSDAVLKEECVIFMAHYDHLGVNNEGEIYNGADDNGSGTVTLMEVAEAFMSLDQKPKRSIVFLWVTAEEIGMLGSNYYTQNPVFPLDKTVACINLDMVGRVFEARDSVWDKSPKLVKDFDGLFTLSNDVWPKLEQINDSICSELGIIPDKSLPPGFLRSSDHYYFHEKGVPILNYATGYHADYHKVSDEVSKINFDKIKRVADLCFLVGLEIANIEK
ncbi:MAG: M20/M25/M40 family metallo-hydrolase [Prolixibacteraceae bacterium]|nr:M20/M25/M40 family metallo-hydrolase [Prolixibacteraceae bacterium]